MDFAFVLAVALAASLLNTITGFGYALVTIPAWMQVMDPKSAVVLTPLTYMVLCPIVMWQAREHVDGRLFRRLFLPSLVGMPLGVYVLVVIDAGLLRFVIGMAIVLASAALLLRFQRPFKDERRAALSIGFIMGLLNTSIVVSSPLVVLFMANQGMGKERLRSTTAAFLFAMLPLTLALLAVGGLATVHHLHQAALIWPVCLLGYLLGVRTLPKVDPGLFRRVTVLLVLAAGAGLLATEMGRAFSR